VISAHSQTGPSYDQTILYLGDKVRLGDPDNSFGPANGGGCNVYYRSHDLYFVDLADLDGATLRYGTCSVWVTCATGKCVRVYEGGSGYPSQMKKHLWNEGKLDVRVDCSTAEKGAKALTHALRLCGAPFKKDPF